MLNDLPYVYMFWLTIFIIGICNLPLTFLIFKKFIDKGYVFSKILGIIFVSYFVWLESSLKILPFSRESIIFSLVLLAGINIFIYLRFLKNHKDLIPNRKQLKLFFLEEILFSGGLLLWSYVRGFAPDIRGLEKFMDFGFINSILKTKYMPPLDMWLAPAVIPDSVKPIYTGSFNINYYYYGHYVTAFLTKLTGVIPDISYNIFLGVICGFCFTGSFSLAFNLFGYFQKSKTPDFLYNKTTILCGLLAGFLVTFGGNLHTIYAFTKGYGVDTPVPFWKLIGPPNPNGYWYPNATRFISNTIHEFPIYSFVVSDLHGHVLDIPFVLLTIALLFSILLSINNPSSAKASAGKQKSKLFKLFQISIRQLADKFQIILLGFLIAVMFMTNAWDGIIYFGLSIIVLAAPSFLNKTVFRDYKKLIIQAVLLFLVFKIFSIPFNQHFIPFAKGIGINCITPNASNQVLCDHSPIWMLAVLWGYFYFFAISYLIMVVIPRKITLTKSDIFTVLLIILSTALLIAPEFIFARDIYPAHYRANTMFKLGYQAFMMLGIVVSYIVFRFLSESPFKPKKIIGKSLWWILACIQLFLVGIYPFFATNSYYNGLKFYQGIDGVSWLWKTYAGDRAAIDYFRYNLQTFEQPTILEAVGESYTDYARISAHTGLPTVLGWPVHEWLWRGSYDESGKRVEEVRKMYESTNNQEVIDLLKKFNIQYVVVGKLERDKYPQLNENNFLSLGEVVFDRGSTKIYKITN